MVSFHSMEQPDKCLIPHDAGLKTGEVIAKWQECKVLVAADSASFPAPKSLGSLFCAASILYRHPPPNQVI